MGIFSSKYVTHVGTTAVRVIEDKFLPNSMQQGAFRALLHGSDLIDNILGAAGSSLAITAERFYSYGASAYVFGTPSGKYQSNFEGASEIQAVLDTLEGSPVLIEYRVFGPPNVLHIGWMKLISEYGYDPTTNKIGALSILKGADVYLHDIEVVVPEAKLTEYSRMALVQKGTPPNCGVSPSRPITMLAGAPQAAGYHSPVIRSATATEDFAKVTYAWETTSTNAQEISTKTLHQETLNISNAEYLESADFYQVKYSVGGVSKYWSYQAGTGTYPQLDSLFGSPATDAGTFFPFVPFRHQQQSMGTDTNSAEYQSLVKATEKIGMNYADILAAIETSESIGDVEQAYLTMAVPAVTTNPIEAKYLFDFFDQLHSNNPEPESVAPTLADWVSWIQKGDAQISMVIADSKIQMQLTMSGIYKRRLVGSIGDIGSHTSLYEAGALQGESNLTNPHHVYRKQITANLYDEIRVSFLTMRYRVWNEYEVTADELDNILLIPLDRSITRQYTFREREELYARSFHLVFNSRVVQKVKWYQQEWFGIVLKVVAVVILIWSWGSSSSASEALWVLAGTAGYYAAAMYILEMLLVYVYQAAIMNYAMRKLAQEVGIEAAIVIAVVMAAYGMSDSNGGNSADSTIAASLLQASNGLTQAAMKGTQDALADIQREMQLLEDEYSEKDKLLDDARKLLEVTHKVDPLMVIGEVPENYFLRTVHAGNVGTISLEAVHSYVDLALTLPSLSQTIGAFENV